MTITARRGDYFLLDHTAGQHVRHTVFQLPGKYGKGVLVTPTVHGNLLVGPTAIDVDDKEATATTAAGLDEVRAKAGLAVKDHAAAPDHHQLCRVCAPTRRGTTSSSARSRPALWTARPSSRPGLSSAPAIGAMVADIVRGQSALTQESPTFDPTRRGILDPKSAGLLQRGRSLSDKTRPTGRSSAGARA